MSIVSTASAQSGNTNITTTVSIALRPAKATPSQSPHLHSEFREVLALPVIEVAV
jgi:hypothetical protein